MYQLPRVLRKYLRFVVNDNVYQFVVLPFSLAPAPFVFTKIMGGGSSLCPYSRGTSTHVSGRLAPPRVLSPGVGASHWLTPGPMLITRTDSQYSEVKLLPLEGFCLSRNKVPDSPLHLLSLEGLMEEAAGCHQEVP